MGSQKASLSKKLSSSGRKFIVGGFATALLFSGASVASASQGSNAAKKTPKPAYSYYAGKTINFVAPGAPGSVTDNLARILAPLIGSYLHCTVIVTNNSTANGIAGQNQVWNSAPNGLTIGIIDFLTDIDNDLNNNDTLNFSLQKLSIISGMPKVPALLASSPGQAYTTWPSIVSATQATPVRVLDVASGSADLAERVIFGAYAPGVHIITGYSSASLMIAGFLRHDGPAALTSVTQFLPYLTSNPRTAVPLLVVGKLQKGSPSNVYFKNTPTLATYYAHHKPAKRSSRAAVRALISLYGGLGQVLFDAPGTPVAMTEALTAATRSALAQTGAINTELADGLAPGYIAPKTTQQTIKNEVKVAAATKIFIAP